MQYEKLSSPEVDVRFTGTPRGLGVYAAREFKAGELVENCPVIVFEEKDWDRLPKLLRVRLFNWSQLINKPPGQHALALGYGSIYNSANPANMKYSGVRSTSMLMFSTIRAAHAGEELTINYDMRGGVNWESESAWGNGNNIELL
ncbi:MAG TPA: SET domain-containing protein-lysine N-methyltransferase [Steroidobacteraceae bacterium]|nr:SET domain-containing protein-lysine N-methyltransferase [Steroidobacteraceae bacterium]